MHSGVLLATKPLFCALSLEPYPEEGPFEYLDEDEVRTGVFPNADPLGDPVVFCMTRGTASIFHSTNFSVKRFPKLGREPITEKHFPKSEPIIRPHVCLSNAT